MSDVPGRWAMAPQGFSDAYHPECPGDDRQDSKPADTHEHDEETRAVGAPPYVEAQVHKERRDSGRSNCDEEKGGASPSLGAAAASAPIEKEKRTPIRMTGWLKRRITSQIGSERRICMGSLIRFPVSMMPAATQSAAAGAELLVNRTQDLRLRRHPAGLEKPRHRGAIGGWRSTSSALRCDDKCLRMSSSVRKHGSAYTLRPHTCATVYMVNDVSGLRRWSRHSSITSENSCSRKYPRATTVPRKDSTVDGR
jgi:hypothetical protein